MKSLALESQTGRRPTVPTAGITDLQTDKRKDGYSSYDHADAVLYVI